MARKVLVKTFSSELRHLYLAGPFLRDPYCSAQRIPRCCHTGVTLHPHARHSLAGEWLFILVRELRSTHHQAETPIVTSRGESLMSGCPSFAAPKSLPAC